MTVQMDDQEEFIPTTGETAEARLRRMARRRGRRLRPEEIIPIVFVVLAVIALLFWLVGLRGGGTGGTALPPLPSPTPAVAMATDTPQVRPFTPTGPVATVAAIATQPPPPTEGPSIPSTIAPGVYVKVTGTGPDMLSFRTGPGLNYARLVKPGTEDQPYLLPDGTILKVLEGPELADDMRWWRLQTIDASKTIGWAVEQYLVPVAPPGQ
jgi:hypothetical protein